MDWSKLISKQRLKKSNTTDVRNEFESDFGRIIYSPALRRMHDKTQVFPLTSDDNMHSRLTHSNEVMSIGYTFGIKLSQSKLIQEKTKKNELDLLRIMPILIQNTCLIHDIGNSPFGHFAEKIFSEYFKNLEKNGNKNFSHLNTHQKRDFLNYDGNAQGLRVLTKLQYLNNIYGLNLTFSTLASYIKYPNYKETNSEKKIENGNVENNKHGVFFSEKEFFEKIFTTCGLKNSEQYFRHPLCYLMEAADSIAYLCMDVEDGYNKNIYNIEYINDCFKDNKSEISVKIQNICNDSFLDSNTKIVNIRINLIRYFVNLAYSNFEKNIDKIENGTYKRELIKDDSNNIYKILDNICIDKIFSHREINFLETTGYSVITGLLDFYVNFLFSDNKDYFKRASRLISKSIIGIAIEENLVNIYENKIVNEEINEINKIELKENIIIYKKLIEKQYFEVLTIEEETFLKNSRFIIYKILKPSLKDLNDYYKFRVIVDFISGMTDKFALKHYQRISGQKII